MPCAENLRGELTRVYYRPNGTVSVCRKRVKRSFRRLQRRVAFRIGETKPRTRSRITMVEVERACQGH